MGADKDIIRKDSKDAGKRASEVGKKTSTVLLPTSKAQRAAALEKRDNK